MTAELGLIALWLAAALAAVQALLPFVGLWKDDAALIATARPAAVVQMLLALLSFLLLMRLFAVTDLSVLLVAANSHSEKPMLYKLAGTWGNHEGSMLLWVTVLAMAGGAIALFERRLSRRMTTAVLAVQAVLSFGFYIFLLLVSNPFARLDPVPAEGNGLNPLLQDPGLAFHPPTLYIGYVGLSVAFAYAVAALLEREVGPAFARAMRPWVLAAWSVLTLGITAGSYWAYYELGWGGYWFWDPVENASLMPWLAATALLHSVTVLATRDALRAWTIMLGVVAFSMSMIGTFLVRSGILTSVHSFAVDPRRGSFILLLLALYIGGALLLFALRAGTVREGATFNLVSREGGLVANNLLLSAILGVVFVGTLYPLAMEAGGDKISVGAPYFQATAAPLALLLVGIMAAGPLLTWRAADPKKLGRRLALPALVAAVALLMLVALRNAHGALVLAGFAAAFFTGVASLLPLGGRKLRRVPLHTWGMVLAHLGIAVSLFGMSANAAWTQEVLAAAKVGETLKIADFRVKLVDVRPTAGTNWTSIEAVLNVERGTGSTLVLRPESRTFTAPVTTTSEAAIRTFGDGQLYTVLGEPDGSGRWQLRLWWKPFVTLIWGGGALIAIGGFLAMAGRLWRERRKDAR